MTGARKTVLVCGATGFIGRNVVDRLSRRPDLAVRATHHSRPAIALDGVEWVRADLTRDEAVRQVMAGVDVVVQMAAVTSGAKDIVERPHIHVTDNAVMNSLLLRAAHDLGVGQFVFPSCAVMYGSRAEPHDETSFRESDPIHEKYFGATWTKLYIEKMCEFYAGLGRVKTAAIRHTNLYGPHDKFDLERSHVFGATVTKAMTAEREVVVWGTGEEGRDFLHVADFVDLVERLIDQQSDPFDLLCAGSGKAVTVADLVRDIVTASGRDLTIRYDTDKPSIPTSIAVGHAKATQVYGWVPRIGLEEGIRQTVAWWRENRPVG